MTKGILQKKREKAAGPKPKPTAVIPKKVVPLPAPAPMPVTRASERTAIEERIRNEVKKELIAATTGSMLTPEIIGYFLSMKYMRVYRLTKPFSIWLPRPEELSPIMDFLKLVELMKQGAEVVLSLRDKLLTMPSDAGRTFLHPVLWQTLKTGSTSTDEKRELLTLRALKVLKARLQKETL